jgi:hypothetical protein
MSSLGRSVNHTEDNRDNVTQTHELIYPCHVFMELRKLINYWVIVSDFTWACSVHNCSREKQLITNYAVRPLQRELD